MELAIHASETVRVGVATVFVGILFWRDWQREGFTRCSQKLFKASQRPRNLQVSGHDLDDCQRFLLQSIDIAAFTCCGFWRSQVDALVADLLAA